MSPRATRWPLVGLGDVIASVKPGFASGERSDDGVIQFRMNNVDRAGNISWNAVTRVPAEHKKVMAYRLEVGDVLFNQTNSRDLVGKTALFRGNAEPIVFSNHFLRLRPHSQRLDGAYLARYLQAIYLTGFFAKKCNAWVNQATYGKDDLLAQRMPLPPLAEQRRIAAILDKADVIRRKRQQALALADEFLRSAFLEMFGAPAGNANGWNCVPIERCVSSIDAGWSAKGLDHPAGSAEVGVLKISAVTSGRYRPEENKAVEAFEAGRSLIIPRKGDLLFSRANTRELVAATCIVDRSAENVFLPDKLWRIRLKARHATPEYLKFVLSDPTFRAGLCSKATGTSGSMLNISQGKLLETEIPLPPIERQQAFSALFWHVEGVRAQIAELAANDDTLFASLSQRAFRGEL